MVGMCDVLGSLILILGGYHFLGPIASNVNPYCYIYERYIYEGSRDTLSWPCHGGPYDFSDASISWNF